MTQDQTHTDGSRIDSTTRRGALAALGGAGLLAALGGSAQADVGGGPESDELAHLLSRFYEGPEDELPEPGVEGRRFLVTDAGGQYEQWSLLRDQGDAWAKVDLNVGSVGAEVTDSAGYRAAASAKRRHFTVPRSDLPWRHGRNPRPIGMQVNEADHWYGYDFFSASSGVYYIDKNGDLAELIDTDAGNGNGFFRDLTVTVTGEFIAIQGDPATVYVYDDESDLKDGIDKGSMTDILPPIDRGLISMWDEDGSGDRFAAWAEYDPNRQEETHRVIKADADGNFETLLSLSDTDIGHLHGLEHDIYNPGTLYAHTGDDDADTEVHRSTDYGDTWEMVAGGAQTWRVLNMAFTEDHIWWATDGYEPDGYSKLYRAERGSIEDPEEVANLSENALSYGVSKSLAANGLLITMKDSEQSGEIDVPVFFWSFDQQRGDDPRVIDVIPGDTSISSSPGTRAPAPAETYRGTHYVRVDGWTDGANDPVTFEYDLSELQQPR